MKVDIQHPNTRINPYIKVHSWDAWSGDRTLALVIAPLVRRVKQDGHGIPGEFYPYIEDETPEEGAKRNEIAIKKWDEILDKIIWSMEEVANKSREPGLRRPTSQTQKDERRRIHQRLFENSSFTEEEEKAYEAWSIDNELYRQRVQEGCDLLGKYFQHLWT